MGHNLNVIGKPEPKNIMPNGDYVSPINYRQQGWLKGKMEYQSSRLNYEQVKPL